MLRVTALPETVSCRAGKSDNKKTKARGKWPEANFPWAFFVGPGTTALRVPLPLGVPFL
jgi:hypothetical protein